MNGDVVRRYRFIDSLRGLAVLGVVIVHVANSILLPEGLISSLLASGSRGVQLFYLVSSLTIFMSLASRAERDSTTHPGSLTQPGSPAQLRPKTSSWVHFFVRRFFRIAPMFYLTALYFLLIDGDKARYFAPDGLEWWTIPLTFTFMHGWHPETINSLVPGGWSIAVEVTFYMLVPFMFLFVNSLFKSCVLVLVTFAGMLLLNDFMSVQLDHHYADHKQYLAAHFFSFWFFSQLPIFSLGIFCFYLLKTIPAQGRLHSLLYLSVFIALFILFALGYIDSKYLPRHIGCGLSFVFLLAALHRHSWSLFTNSLTVALGKISFSVYLVHFIVIKRSAYSLIPKIESLVGAGYVTFAVYLFFVMLVTCAVGYLTYRFIEKPGMALGRKICNGEFRWFQSGLARRRHLPTHPS